MDKYNLYNDTVGQWECVISDALPTVCPSNPADVIRAGSIVIVESDIKVNDGTPKELTLPNYKLLRYNEFDIRTGELIEEGFTYDTDKKFSLSQNAQINISALNQSRDELNYPIVYTTINDDDTYSVIDAADMHTMYLTALNTKKGFLDSGSALKTDVRDCTTEAEVDAIIDNR